jgi:putative ABC transport system ATP-binding protein
MQPLLSLQSVSKAYASGSGLLTVLDKVDFLVHKGESLAIVGPSGSGKTTLLGLCAGLDLPTQGRVVMKGIQISSMDEDDRAWVRNQYVGFVFQNFQLFPTLTALENVMLPLEMRGGASAADLARDLLERVGLSGRLHHYPSQLSGGEQQRVAIARAFITSPEILFADEPTGNLDEESAAIIRDLLFSINKELGTTLILVTHNLELAALTERIVRLKGGKIISDEPTSQPVWK